MRNKMKTVLLTVVAAMTATVFVNAATITSKDAKIEMTTPDESWHTVEDVKALLALTNGKDRVIVDVYATDAELPKPLMPKDTVGFEETYQTYYTTANSIYVITGYAQTKEDIKDVRKVMESLQLADHKTNEMQQGQGNNNLTPTPTPAQGPTFDEIADNINYTNYMYYEDGTPLKIYVLNDGRILDPNGMELYTFADGALKTSSGEIVYEFDPTTMSLDEFLNGGNTEEDDDSYYVYEDDMYMDDYEY